MTNNVQIQEVYVAYNPPTAPKQKILSPTGFFALYYSLFTKINYGTGFFKIIMNNEVASLMNNE